MPDFLDIKTEGENAKIPSPTLCIVLLTYMRTDMAVRTIEGVADYLEYPNRTWYIADDGSPQGHMDAIFAALARRGETLYQYHNETFSQRPYCGTGWNIALGHAHNLTDYVLWLEDDWVLKKPIDIRPYIRLLMEKPEVGIVSMRGLSLGLRMEVTGHNGIHYLKIMKYGFEGSMCYSGNPHIRHRRYTDHYGYFSTNNSPGDIEIVCDNQYRGDFHGPEIWRPADWGDGYSGWGIFGHIGKDKTW